MESGSRVPGPGTGLFRGVSTAELTEHLESMKIPGLYFVGEAVDVDGSCGGYNLQWACPSERRQVFTAGNKLSGRSDVGLYEYNA